jgi:PKD repeat protein
VTKSNNTKIYWTILFGLFLLNIFLLACSKDNDLLNDVITEVPQETILEDFEAPISVAEETTNELSYENRFKSFPPIHDAFVQSGKGFNQNLMRLEKENRIGYLMFDLSPIDAVGGNIKAVTLQFTVKYDEDEGMIKIYQGDSNDWTEGTLTATTAPSTDVELGSLLKKFLSNETEYINLNHELFDLDQNSLVVTYSGSSQISLASKEHADKVGPKLVVTYEVPEGADEITLEGEEEQEVNTESEGNTEANENYETDDSGEESVDETEEEASADNQAPVAKAEANITQGVVPLQVNFDASTSTDDNEIISYQWDFKDGGGSSNPSPSHTYTEIGSYEVMLTVTDNQGVSNSDTIAITVSEPENQAPKAVATANVSIGIAPLELKFTGSGSTDDEAVVSYSWDFKDGGGSSNINPTHTFTEAGSYEVTLTVKDEDGLTHTDTIAISVEQEANVAPTAIASSDVTSGEAPLTVNFVGNQSTDDNGITSYYWDFKDGSTSTEISPTHTFQNPGTYLVEFVVTDANGESDTDIDTIVVTAPETNTGNYPPDAVFASSFGFNPTDATNAIKEAINSSSSYIVIDKQASDWIVEPLNFVNLNNKTIVFEPGVILKAKSGAFAPSHRLMQLTYSNNIEIIGYEATFKMNKNEYTSGDQRHALAIVNSSEITIKGLTFKGSGGDGIYISRFNNGEYCQNILIEDVISTDNKRQGMSVISVDGLTVRNSSFTNTLSLNQAPGAGVDFEPESVNDRLIGINFYNCTFTGNFGPGILFALSKTSGNSLPIEASFYNSFVGNNYSPSNPRGYESEIELGMSTSDALNPIKGNIIFDGLRVENSKWSAIWSKKTAEAYHVTLKNVIIKNVSTASSLAAIHIGVLSYANFSSANMGGYTFENVLIDYDGVDASLELFGPSHGNFDLKDLTGEIRVQSPRGIRFEDNLDKLAGTNSSSVNLRIVED